VFIPYACGFIQPDGKVFTYYVTDSKNPRDMLKNSLVDMLESDLATVYVHNLSKFDTYFIEPILTNDLDVIGKSNFNNNLSIKVSYKDKKRKTSFIFRDSMLMLSAKLKDLSKSFKTEKTKLDFPHKDVC
jgi:hypothetical protein